MTTPDLSGFAEAQERLREQFGENVEFYGSASVTFPPGTPLDPDTDLPYDPTIAPTASARTSGVVRVNVAQRQTTSEQDVAGFGFTDSTHVMLIAASAAASAIVGSVEFGVRGSAFEVQGTRFDGVAGVQRLLVFGRKQ